MTGTVTSTVVQIAKVTSTSTATVFAPCNVYPGTNGGFELGTFSTWNVYNPVSGAGGSWTLVAGNGAGHGAYTAQVSMKNPGNVGGFAAYITRNLNVCSGRSYTLKFDYRCMSASSAAYFQPYGTGGVGFGSSLTCYGQVGTWLTTSYTFTATSSSIAAGVWTVQNGGSDTAIFQFDNFSVMLNQ